MKSSLNLYRREYVRSFIIVHHGKKEFVWILLVVSPRVCQDCVLIICLSIKKNPMYTIMELRQSWLNILDPKLYINRWAKFALFYFVIHNLLQYFNIIKSPKQHYFVEQTISLKLFMNKKSIKIFNLIMHNTPDIRNQ